MKNIIPRISTRGYYDLRNGRTIKKNNYFLYPRKSFDKIHGSGELTIMIHGLQNDKAGAVAKAKRASSRLRYLGYKFPVIGFSYDSDVVGAHLPSKAKHAISIGNKIAKKNGYHLSKFILDFKKKNPNTKIRLIGHSLGSQVILSTVENLGKNTQNRGIIESVYFFGASIAKNTFSSKKHGQLLSLVIKKKILNYYSPHDEVLFLANKENLVKEPLGLNGSKGKMIKKYFQKKVHPKNHRFTNYAAVLNSFP